MVREFDDFYVFIIDTEEYAGNFEREMTAYITGQVGDCGVGDREAAMFIDEESSEKAENMSWLVKHISDDHGCHRPCSIYPTSGWFNNGMGGQFRDTQWEEAVEHYKLKVAEREAAHKKVYGHLDPIPKFDPPYSLDGPKKRHPAYMSVGIFFNEAPSDDVTGMMIRRALQYNNIEKRNEWDSRPVITGFRLAHQRTVLDDNKKWDKNGTYKG